MSERNEELNKKSRSLKKARRSKSEIIALKIAIYELAEAENPMTIRHLFYRLVSKGVLDKDELAYKGTLVRVLGLMRENGEIPFEWFVDSTRWMRKPRTHNSIDDLLEESQRTYRRALWREQPFYCEVWTEKDAIATILSQTTAKFDVPLMVCRGFSSKTFLYSTGKAIKAQGKPTYIFYLGDCDPSGISISTVIERDLRKYSDDSEIYFKRLAVTDEQIIDWELPIRPTKKTDSRAKNFVGESVEIDAIPAADLQNLVNNAIVDLIDPDAYWVVKAAEESERESLTEFRKLYQMQNEED